MSLASGLHYALGYLSPQQFQAQRPANGQHRSLILSTSRGALQSPASPGKLALRNTTPALNRAYASAVAEQSCRIRLANEDVEALEQTRGKTPVELPIRGAGSRTS